MYNYPNAEENDGHLSGSGSVILKASELKKKCENNNIFSRNSCYVYLTATLGIYLLL